MPILILFNANVITMDPTFPKTQLVVIKNNRILAVGRNEDLKKFENTSTNIIDCKGKTVLPGFIDAHCHIPSLAESFVTLHLNLNHA